MKIRLIEFIDHPILGTITFDFCDKEGDVIDTIIIAGENGVGKSVLLNEIFFYISTNGLKSKDGSKVNITYELSEHEKNMLAGHFGNIDSVVTFHYDNSVFEEPNWNQVTFTYHFMGEIKHLKRQDNMITTVFNLLQNKIFARKAIFSDVEINFSPKAINSTKATILDSNIESERSNNNLANEITQLLVDIDNQDNSDLSRWVKEHPNQAPTEEVKQIRTKRFSSAFEYMFPNKKYYGIEDVDRQKVIFFEENRRKISISNLSTGEKQIVFRGGFLLKNQKKNVGAIVLIDEPEISLHPDWQFKILNYFRKLFTDADGIQTSQFIIVTHSPFIIHNINRVNDKIIIMKRDENGKVIISEHPEFYSWSDKKIIQEAFNLNLYPDEVHPIVLLEGEIDELYFNKAIEVFDIKTNIKFEWIGRITDNNTAEFTGDTALNDTKKFFLANKSFLKNKVVLLYDCDTNKPNENHGQLLVRSMPKNERNKKSITKGIENLLILEDYIPYKNFITERPTTDGYVTYSKPSLNKTTLSHHICNELDSGQQRETLSLIRDVIQQIIQEL